MLSSKFISLIFLFSDKRYKKPYRELNDITTKTHPNSLLTPPNRSEKTSSNAENVHKWVYDLKGLDNSKDFSKMFLVIVRGDTSKIDHLSWEQVKNLTQNDILAAITSVLFIPRRSHGQLYIVKGLNSSLHFSLGSNGQQALSTYLTTNSINEYIMNGHETLMKNKLNNNVIDCGVFVKTANQHKKSQIEQGYYKLMIDMACHLWGNLLGVSQNIY
mgnify:CR=1 FL=1